MTGSLWLRLAFIAVYLLQTEGTHAAEQLPRDVILSLGVLGENGALEDRLTELWAEELKRSEQLAGGAALRPGDRRCRTAACLDLLAEPRQASIVVFGDIRRVDRRRRRLELRVYDTRTRSSLGIAGTTESDLEPKLRELAPRLLKEFRTPLAASLREGSAEGSELSIRLSLPPPPRFTWRSAWGGVMGSLAALSLGGAVALTVLNHSPTEARCEPYYGAPGPCVTEYSGLYGTGYALAALSGIGSGLLLWWDQRRARQP